MSIAIVLNSIARFFYFYENDLLGAPCIFVHPNPKAKSGKFDCSVMSLSVLLDYRTDDNKEGTFEVSLFAELFNEMLMRDSGFKLYKAIVDVPEKTKEEKKAAAKTDDDDGSNGKKDADSDSKEDTNNANASSEAEKAKRKKLVTYEKDLLLACSYFDLGHSGYFETKDLEEILLTLNLSLSRAQIRKLVSKVTTSKDQVSYRVLTDRPEDEIPELSGNLMDEDKDEAEKERIRQMSLGFKAFLPKTSRNQPNSNVQGESQVEGLCQYKGNP